MPTERPYKRLLHETGNRIAQWPHKCTGGDCVERRLTAWLTQKTQYCGYSCHNMQENMPTKLLHGIEIMAARKWTPEQKARQAQLIHGWKPWAASTGPRTSEGKAVVAKNSPGRYFRDRYRFACWLYWAKRHGTKITPELIAECYRRSDKFKLFEPGSLEWWL